MKSVNEIEALMLEHARARNPEIESQPVTFEFLPGISVVIDAVSGSDHPLTFNVVLTFAGAYALGRYELDSSVSLADTLESLAVEIGKEIENEAVDQYRRNTRDILVV